MDDMGKIKVGTPAVSRYHQFRILYPQSGMPNYADNDFPVPNYLLSAAGYMILDDKDEVISAEKCSFARFNI